MEPKSFTDLSNNVSTPAKEEVNTTEKADDIDSVEPTSSPDLSIDVPKPAKEEVNTTEKTDNADTTDSAEFKPDPPVEVINLSELVKIIDFSSDIQAAQAG